MIFLPLFHHLPLLSLFDSEGQNTYQKVGIPMNHLKMFKHEQFGRLEILLIDGKEKFPQMTLQSSLVIQIHLISHKTL